jgi:hypothetical protein
VGSGVGVKVGVGLGVGVGSGDGVTVTVTVGTATVSPEKHPVRVEAAMTAIPNPVRARRDDFLATITV